MGAMIAEDGGSSIVVSRNRRGWRDRARSYDIVIDGQQVANIKRGQRMELPVLSGRYQVFMRINWGTSESIQIDVPPGESVELFCRTGRSQVGAGYIGLSRV
jgi:hypothetical protein